MRARHRLLPVTLATLLLASLPAVAQQQEAASAQQPAQPTAQQSFQEMERMLGTVPEFFRKIPEAAVPGAWAEMKSLQLSPDTALSGKHKELIGLAVAAQIPCDYCVYFHTAAAKAAGASEQEIQETIGMAAITRHWSTVLNGSQIDLQAFRQQADAILQHAQTQGQAAQSPPAQGQPAR